MEKIFNNDTNSLYSTINDNNIVKTAVFNCEIHKNNIAENNNTINKNNENKIDKDENQIKENKSINNVVDNLDLTLVDDLDLTLKEIIYLFKIIINYHGKKAKDIEYYFNRYSLFIFCDPEEIIGQYIEKLIYDNIFIKKTKNLLNLYGLFENHIIENEFVDIEPVMVLKKIIKNNTNLYEKLKTQIDNLTENLNENINKEDITNYKILTTIKTLYDKLKEIEQENEKNKNIENINNKQINTKEKHINIDNKSKVEDITLIECVNTINNLKKDNKLKQSIIQKITVLNKDIENENNKNPNDIENENNENQNNKENKDENIDNKKEELPNKSDIELLKIKEDNKKKELSNKSVIELLKIKEDQEKELVKLKEYNEKESNKSNSNWWW